MMDAIRSQIAKSSGQIRQCFLGLVARGGSKTLQLTGVADEVLQDTELLQQVGFNSHIPTNAKVVIVPLQGKTAKSIVVATSGGSISITVGEGETCIYDQFGHSVWLKQDGTHIEGDLFVNGEVKDKKGTLQEMRNLYNGHHHGSSPAPDAQM